MNEIFNNKKSILFFIVLLANIFFVSAQEIVETSKVSSGSLMLILGLYFIFFISIFIFSIYHFATTKYYLLIGGILGGIVGFIGGYGYKTCSEFGCLIYLPISFGIPLGQFLGGGPLTDYNLWTLVSNTIFYLFFGALIGLIIGKIKSSKNLKTNE